MGALNDGALCLMVSIGHRTGLFDAMRGQAPHTSDEIARRAGLNERHVREWLGAMVTSGVISVDPQSVHYYLPPEHAAHLTRAAGADNLAVFAQYVPLLGIVEDDIVESFDFITSRNIPLHGVLPPLHDGVIGSRRRRAGRDVGRGEDP